MNHLKDSYTFTMPGSKLVSRGTAYFAVISTLNLLIIMAAIANDGKRID